LSLHHRSLPYDYSTRTIGGEESAQGIAEQSRGFVHPWGLNVAGSCQTKALLCIAKGLENGSYLIVGLQVVRECKVCYRRCYRNKYKGPEAVIRTKIRQLVKNHLVFKNVNEKEAIQCVHPSE
jgi:hypothetical protein